MVALTGEAESESKDQSHQRQEPDVRQQTAQPIGSRPAPMPAHHLSRHPRSLPVGKSTASMPDETDTSGLPGPVAA